MNETTTRITAEKINEALTAGKIVDVCTYGRCTRYQKKHAGMFRESRGNLYVASGKKSLCLSMGDRLLVAIRIYSVA